MVRWKVFFDEVSEHPSNISFDTSAERRIEIHDFSSSVLPDLLVRRRILHFYLVTTAGQGVFVIWLSSIEFFLIARNIRNTFVDHNRQLLDDVWRVV